MLIFANINVWLVTYNIFISICVFEIVVILLNYQDTWTNSIRYRDIHLDKVNQTYLTIDFIQQIAYAKLKTCSTKNMQ